MQTLYYGVDDGDGNVPGNIIEDDEMVSSVLIPIDDLSDREKPGSLEIEPEGEPEILQNAVEIDPSEYLVERWEDGKAKRIFSGMMSKLDDEWMDIKKLEVYGDGSIYVNEEEIKGKFTVTYGSAVLIKDVQEVCYKTDEEMEKEYYHCVYCDKKIKSYKAIEEMVPDNWLIGSREQVEEDKVGHIEEKEDGTYILHGICPDCAEERDIKGKKDIMTHWG